MLVATFGPTTSWVGKTITWVGNQFMLEGYGPVPAAALVDYDQHGHLRWVSNEMRSWAWAYAHWESGGVPPAQAVQPQAAAQPWAAAQQATVQPWAAAQQATAGGPAGGKKPFPVWAIVLIVAMVMLLVGGLFAAIFIPAVVMNDQHAKADESAVKEGVHNIMVGVQSWAVDHQDRYPSAAEVNQSGLSRYIDWWPTNPYTGSPMIQGSGPGDFSYEASPDGSSCRLAGYGKGGKVIIDVSLGGGITV